MRELQYRKAAYYGRNHSIGWLQKINWPIQVCGTLETAFNSVRRAAWHPCSAVLHHLWKVIKIQLGTQRKPKELQAHQLHFVTWKKYKVFLQRKDLQSNLVQPSIYHLYFPTKACPLVHHLKFIERIQKQRLNHLPGQPIQVPDHWVNHAWSTWLPSVIKSLDLQTKGEVDAIYLNIQKVLNTNSSNTSVSKLGHCGVDKWTARCGWLPEVPS